MNWLYSNMAFVIWATGFICGVLCGLSIGRGRRAR